MRNFGISTKYKPLIITAFIIAMVYLSAMLYTVFGRNGDDSPGIHVTVSRYQAGIENTTTNKVSERVCPARQGVTLYRQILYKAKIVISTVEDDCVYIEATNLHPVGYPEYNEKGYRLKKGEKIGFITGGTEGYDISISYK